MQNPCIEHAVGDGGDRRLEAPFAGSIPETLPCGRHDGKMGGGLPASVKAESDAFSILLQRVKEGIHRSYSLDAAHSKTDLGIGSGVAIDTSQVAASGGEKL